MPWGCHWSHCGRSARGGSSLQEWDSRMVQAGPPGMVETRPRNRLSLIPSTLSLIGTVPRVPSPHPGHSAAITDGGREDNVVVGEAQGLGEAAETPPVFRAQLLGPPCGRDGQ